MKVVKWSHELLQWIYCKFSQKLRHSFLILTFLCSINFVDALKGVGADAELILYEGKSHTDLFLQVSDQYYLFVVIKGLIYLSYCSLSSSVYFYDMQLNENHFHISPSLVCLMWGPFNLHICWADYVELGLS